MRIRGSGVTGPEGPQGSPHSHSERAETEIEEIFPVFELHLGSPPLPSFILTEKRFDKNIKKNKKVKETQTLCYEKNRSLAENGRGYEAFDWRVLGGSEFVQDLWRKEELKDEIRRPRKEWFLAQVRGVVCYLAVRELGYRGVGTGKELRLGPAGVSIAVRRGEAYLKEKPGLKRE
jgi:hypothetical protein